MKNHWLDKKINREIDLEIDKACEEILKESDTIFIDMATSMNTNYRYKDYDRLGAGGDGIKLEETEVKTSQYGEICSVCNTEMWPMNNENTMMQGDPMCDCHKDASSILDSWYANRFIQNETLRVISDEKGVTQYITEFSPVVPSSMTGTISIIYENGQVNYSLANWEGSGLICNTGVLHIRHNFETAPTVVVSYEFDRD